MGQIARYLGWYAKTEGKAPRGILIARNFLISSELGFKIKQVTIAPKGEAAGSVTWLRALGLSYGRRLLTFPARRAEGTRLRD